MSFQKGKSGNPNGRPGGALNKKTIEQSNRAQALLEEIEAQPDFKDMVKNMSQEKRAALYVALLEYDLPKKARVEHTDGEGGPIVITVRHSAEPLPTPTQQPAIQDADYITLPQTTKRPF